jgi:cobalt-zinc-cadmium efflux system protein
MASTCCQHGSSPNGHAALGHSHAPAGVSPVKLLLAVGLTLALVLGEAIAAGFSGSLALLGDAGHNFADAAALGFSTYALWVAAKPSNAGMTFGYHRVAILAAFGNALFLAVVALGLVYEAAVRMSHPQPVAGGVMALAAGAAIGVNLLIGFWLRRGAAHDINLRGAYLHMLADAASAAGVVAAGLAVRYFHLPLIDPLVSFAIAGLILWSSWGILSESVRILLEATPRGLDMLALQGHIAAVPGVDNVHDLHVWTVGPGAVAASCHVRVREQSIRAGQQICSDVAGTLRDRFAITHTTVQVEVEGDGATACDGHALYCNMRASHHAADNPSHHAAARGMPVNSSADQ